ASNGTTLGLKGSDVKIDKNWEVTAKDGKITIKHYDEKTGKEIEADTKTYESYYADGFRHIVNYSNGSVLNAADLAALLESKINSKDEIVLKVINKKLYGVIEEQNIFGTVTAATDKDGNAKIKLLDNAEITVKVADLKVGDRVFGFLNNKTEKYELTKVAPTTEYFTVVLDNNGTTKYYKDAIAEASEIKLGAAFATSEYKSYVAPFKADEPAYWDLYIVDGYCFDAVKTDKVASLDAKVTAKSVVTNTIDGKVIYTFALEDANKVAYTFTYTPTNTAEIELYHSIAKDDTVVYYYDAKTKAAIGIKEFDVLTVTETEVLNADAFGNVDTKVALVADAIAKLAEVTDENIQYRIVLPAANAGQTLPVIFGDADQEANLDNAIAAAKAVAEVILPEYDYTKTETKVVNSVDSAVAALNSGAIDVVIVDAKVTSNPFNGKYAINNSIEFVDCTFSANMNYMYIKDATFTNCTFDCGSDYAAVHYDELHGDLVFNNCTFKSGKIQIGTNSKGILSSVTFNDCVFAETEKTSIWSEMGMRVYSTAVFNNCEFNNRVVLSGVTGLSITFDSCTMNGGDAVYYVDNTDGIIRGGNVPVVTIK
ncbi:MAG: hypothetical protein IKW66_01115, partial [Clostridia bacterium]|nr:hypothetical protein [Clostridia bacterium]